MIIVKISTYDSDWPLLRQTPGKKGIWGNVQFFVNDDTVKECDYWIVYEGFSNIEKALCPKNNICFVSGEPPSKRQYKTGYIRQFAKVITCHRGMRHRNKIYWQQANPWHVGRRQINNRDIEFSKDYDELNSMDEIPKTKLISVICSNKIKIKGQRDRLQFVSFLKEYFKDKIDVFGRGIREIEDKWDAIAPYKYHVTLENSCYDDCFTEKLSDVFLAGTYPIYHGAGNIYSYFPEESLTCIDIYKPLEAVKTIEMVMENRYYEKYKLSIMESRKKVLDEYNLFPTIVDKIIKPDMNKNKVKVEITLKPEHYYGFRAIETTVRDIFKIK